MYTMYIHGICTGCTYTVYVHFVRVRTPLNTLSHNHQLHIEMECIGILPAPEDVIQTSTFIWNTAEPGQCYFCFGQMDGEELLAMTVQCCQQKAHCRCFQMWAAQYNGTAIGTVRCGYCRTPFSDKELCYLCLQNKNNGQELNKTRCCQTTIHKD
jgi:hypothetical protein